MKDRDRHGKHNSRQSGNNAGNEKIQGRWAKEKEGEEKSSHRVSIKVYHSSMQCGVWPRPLKTRPERLYHSLVGGLETRGYLCACLPAVYCWQYVLFF